MADDIYVVLVGKGGREDAIGRAVANSRLMKDIYATPGNPGIAEYAECLPIPATDINGILDFAAGLKPKGQVLIVVGPEAPLAVGIVDKAQKRDLPIIGPTAAAARVETSKTFALERMYKSRVPTGWYRSFTPCGSREVLEVENCALWRLRKDGGVVIKPDGLTEGKGVRVCLTEDEVRLAIYEIVVQKIHGAAGDTVVVMEHLGDGQEFSVFALVDKAGHIAILGAAQDHKRLRDGDKGPNTGGMGAYSPVPFVNDTLLDEVWSRILKPMVCGLAKDGIPYYGFLYAGLMMTPHGPRVLEFNCRLGDPEAQVILPLLGTDFLELLVAAAAGRLDRVPVEFKPGAATCVVMASQGYPEKPVTGFPITGIEEAEQVPGVSVFHAGTNLDKDGRTILTAGGRVVGVTAIKDTLAEAIGQAYLAVDCIKFEGRQYRKDIVHRALAG